MLENLLDAFSMGSFKQNGVPLLIGLLSGLIPFLLIFFLFKKRQAEKAAYFRDEKLEPIDEELLAAAENDVKDINLLKSLHENYLHIKSFQTINGHDNNTMTGLVVYLKEKGVEADFYFHQTYPVGFASATSGMGEYFLFVDPAKKKQALKLLDQYFGIKA